MTTLTVLAVAALAVHGLPVDLARSIQVEAVPGLNGSSASITIGHLAFGVSPRRQVVAETLVPSTDDALALLADRDRLAGFLGQALPSLPASMREQAPAWVKDSVDAARARRLADRASVLANDAANAMSRDNLPFAA